MVGGFIENEMIIITFYTLRFLFNTDPWQLAKYNE